MVIYPENGRKTMICMLARKKAKGKRKDNFYKFIH